MSGNDCRFRSGIMPADFGRTKFAVELHEFLDGTADRTYQNPRTFFDNAFLVGRTGLLVRDTTARPDSGGQPVTVIDTGFGGGKTHSLLLLLMPAGLAKRRRPRQTRRGRDCKISCHRAGLPRWPPRFFAPRRSARATREYTSAVYLGERNPLALRLFGTMS